MRTQPMDITSGADNRPPLFSPGNTLPFVLVTALPFLCTIPNNLNGIFIRQGGICIIMAMIGGAAAPRVMGLLYGVWHSMAVAMIVPLVCHAVVVHYVFTAPGCGFPNRRPFQSLRCSDGCADCWACRAIAAGQDLVNTQPSLASTACHATQYRRPKIEASARPFSGGRWCRVR